MDILSQKKLLVRLVVIMAILNLSIIGYLGWKTLKQKSNENEPSVQPQALSEVLQKELNLSNEQTISFKKIREEFFEKEKTLSAETKMKRDSMNILMFNESNSDSLLKVLALGVSQNEYKMELMRIEQAARIKSILTAAQAKHLNKLIKEIRDYLKPENFKK